MANGHKALVCLTSQGTFTLLVICQLMAEAAVAGTICIG